MNNQKGPACRQAGLAPIILILLAAAGIIIYLLLTNTASFKDRLFSLLYPKPISKATVTPVVFKSSEGEILPVNAANIPVTSSADVKIELVSTLGSPVASTSATPEATPSAETEATAESEPDVGIKTGTTFYRIAESSEELDDAEYEPYIQEPTIIDYTFDDTLGSKYIWVEFKDSAGGTDRKAAQIELIAAPSSTETPSSTPSSTPQPTLTPKLTSKPTSTPILKQTSPQTPTPKPVLAPTPAKLSAKPLYSPAPISPSRTSLLVSPSPAATLGDQNLQTKDENCGIFCGFGKLVEGINKVLERGMEQILKRFGLLSDE